MVKKVWCEQLPGYTHMHETVPINVPNTLLPLTDAEYTADKLEL